ncbi:zinc finger protein 813 [Folsomia candida]|nr:zinc finger protein 813 [Folsomia candida]XP_035714928.1 zinc finger protein 813 [Folsomia candida]XP_035714929.1 zinc finger protein 813 [Folsomia candida]XP_035714930.1 zinc finger protein 813 [Folsomia candida]
MGQDTFCKIYFPPRFHSRSNFVPRQENHVPREIDDGNKKSSPEFPPSCCSICSGSSNLSRLALQEMELLVKFVLTREQVSLIFQTGEYPQIFCCKICSSAILSLAKLSKTIENVTISLRAVISGGNGVLNKLGKGYKISELANGDGAILLKNEDQQLAGCRKRGQFTVKVEPLEEDQMQIEIPEISENKAEIPDEIPEISEIQDEMDAATSSEPVVDPESKFGLKMSQPFVVTRSKGMRNVVPAEIWDESQNGINLVGGLPASKFSCKICANPFNRPSNLRRHMRNMHNQADDSATETSDDVKKRLVDRPEGEYSCPQCDKRFGSKTGLVGHSRSHKKMARCQGKCSLCRETFTDFMMLLAHRKERHGIPLGVGTKTFARPACDICSKTYSSSGSLYCHVERIHFRDKTSCPYGCGVEIGSEVEWVTHLEGCDSPKMTAQSASPCFHCDVPCRNMLLRVVHTLREHPDKTFYCSKCEGRFSKREVLVHHRCKPIAKESRVG